ncbi:winged helix-turn-helix transcriptional regulator [Epilithonimonas sp.]|uniref:winged helix-turn-helix transcriptional regulator n=1 Tax=Epilithonimonas sp. TaxID=2894511 RepID=UPI0028A8694E|nr:HTH domain-containing protein [Epilithonimonas sp.]
MKKEKTLQKLTDLESKVEALFKLDTITEEHTEALSAEEMDIFRDKMNEKFVNLKGTKRDRFIKQTEEINSPEVKNKLWEYNNVQIMNFIISFVNECGVLPQQSQIADKTGLSRQTIHKHLKELQNNQLYKDLSEQFKFMQQKVLGEVLRQAIKGDMKAAKLYLDVVSGQRGKTKINTQNNYLQINGILVDEEKLSKLKPDQLQQLERILQSVSDAEVI